MFSALFSKESNFLLLDLEVDLSTLMMTLNNKNNIRSEFSTQSYTKERYHTCSYLY